MTTCVRCSRTKRNKSTHLFSKLVGTFAEPGCTSKILVWTTTNLGLFKIRSLWRVYFSSLALRCPSAFSEFQTGQMRCFSFSEWISALLSLKGCLILVVTGIFLYILAIFWRVSHPMEFKEEVNASLPNDTVLNRYSPYLTVQAAN